MANDIFKKENISTIAVWVYMIISPILVKYGIDIDQATFTAFFVALFGIILAIWSSRNPNDLEVLGNGATPEVGSTEPEYMDDDCA